jgi:hypothetical protein
VTMWWIVLAMALAVLGLAATLGLCRAAARSDTDYLPYGAEPPLASPAPRKRYDRAYCNICGKVVAITAAGAPIRGRHRCLIVMPEADTPEEAA